MTAAVLVVSCAPIDGELFACEIDRDDLSVVEVALLDCCAPIDDATAAELAKLGVKGDALGDLFVAPVCFNDDQFVFARTLACDLETWRRAVMAVIVPARDSYGEAFDLVVLNLRDGAAATWRGEASILGSNSLWRLGDSGLRVYPTVLEWLRAERDGIVILDAAEARWWLMGERLLVSDPAFGRLLREALRLPEPEILLERGAACFTTK